MHVRMLTSAAGTMLFGEGTSEAEAAQLLSHAAENGVNFFDTAGALPCCACSLVGFVAMLQQGGYTMDRVSTTLSPTSRSVVL